MGVNYQIPYDLSVKAPEPAQIMQVTEGGRGSFDFAAWEFIPMNWRRAKRHQNRLRKITQRMNKIHGKNAKEQLIIMDRTLRIPQKVFKDLIGSRGIKAV